MRFHDQFAAENVGVIHLPRSLGHARGRVLGSRRTLSFAQWDQIESRVRLDLVSASASVRRCARAIALLYATGLRRAAFMGRMLSMGGQGGRLWACRSSGLTWGMPRF